LAAKTLKNVLAAALRFREKSGATERARREMHAWSHDFSSATESGDPSPNAKTKFGKS
jgi:hypothetical protein